MSFNRRLVPVASLLAIDYLALVLMDPDTRTPFEIASIGFFLGSLYAHATLAGAWLALGPGEARSRVAFSMCWIVALPIAIGANVTLNGGPNDAWLMVGGCLIALWFLVQIILALVKWRTGIEILLVSDADTSPSKSYQFRILDVMVLMTIAAVLLGIGRSVVPHLSALNREIYIFVFLAVASTILLLPVLLAALLGKRSVLGTTFAILFLVVGTYLEGPIVKSLGIGPGGQGDFIYILFAINVASATLILIVAFLIRLAGYRLYAPREALMH